MWTRNPPTRCRSVRGWARSRRRESDPGLHRGLALSLPGGGLPRPYPARPTTHSRAELRPQWHLRKCGDAAERAQNAIGVRPLRHRQRQRPAGCGTAARRSDRDKKGTIDRTAHRLDQSVYRRNRFTISSLGLEAPSGFEPEMEVLQLGQDTKLPSQYANLLMISDCEVCRVVPREATLCRTSWGAARVPDPALRRANRGSQWAVTPSFLF